MAPLITRMSRSVHHETPSLSQYIQAVDLTTSPGVAGSFTVPAGCNHIYVTSTAGVLWYNASGATAAAASAAVTTGAGSGMILQGRSMAVAPGQVISFFNSTACYVIVECRTAEIA